MAGACFPPRAPPARTLTARPPHGDVTAERSDSCARPRKPDRVSLSCSGPTRAAQIRRRNPQRFPPSWRAALRRVDRRPRVSGPRRADRRPQACLPRRRRPHRPRAPPQTPPGCRAPCLQRRPPSRPSPSAARARDPSRPGRRPPRQRWLQRVAQFRGRGTRRQTGDRRRADLRPVRRRLAGLRLRVLWADWAEAARSRADACSAALESRRLHDRLCRRAARRPRTPLPPRAADRLGPTSRWQLGAQTSATTRTATTRPKVDDAADLHRRRVLRPPWRGRHRPPGLRPRSCRTRSPSSGPSASRRPRLQPPLKPWTP